MESLEKKAFSERLRLALARGHKRAVGATELSLQFNLRYKNTPITPQAAQKWLSGQAIPTSDKIDTLAAWLKVSSHWLRYGSEMREENFPLLNSASPIDMDLIFHLSLLTAEQKELVFQLVSQLIHNKAS